jgi:hypothetical protein
MKLAMTETKNIEESYDELWVSDVAFFVTATDHLNSLNKRVQGKVRLVTEMFNNISMLKVKLGLSENQLQVRNFLHFLQLRFLKIVFLSWTYSRNFQENFSSTRGVR